MVAPRPDEPIEDARYLPQALFPPLGPRGQARLRSGRVLVVGCGALGTHAAEHLARAGVGSLRLVDRDVVEWSNLHRQCGYTEADARESLPKVLALAAHLGRINSGVRLDPRVADFHYQNALDLAEGADLIIDGSDNVPTRLLLNDVSLERKIPWVYSGAVGETGHVQFFHPAAGPCLRCLLPDVPAAGELATCDTAGVLGPAAGAAASFQAAMALRYLGGGPEEIHGLVERQLRLQVWTLGVSVARVPRDPGCPACAQGRREFLAGRLGDLAAVLCGRGAVQVRPARAPQIDLEALADRLRALGKVEARRFLLRFQAEETSFTLFPDGRMIVEGTTDAGRARAVYARYLGE